MSKLVFPKALKELRIHLGQQGGESAAVNHYAEIKAANQTTPILIREALGVKPAAYARFEKGREERVSLEGVSDVGAALKRLVGL